MRIERINKCCGSRGVLTAVDFQPHFTNISIHRIATAGGTYVQIWALGRKDGSSLNSPIECVCLYKFTDHSPYEVSTVRWSPNGQHVASTDSGGITHVLVRNSKKSEQIEAIINNKLNNGNIDVPSEIIETKEVKKYTFKYDATNSPKNKLTLSNENGNNNRITHTESHDVVKDSFKIFTNDNLDGNLESWETLGAIHCPSNMGQLFDISWAPDNRSIVGGGMNGQVAVFDIYTKEIVAKFDTSIPGSVCERGYVKSVAWDPMTLHIAVQNSNKEISIWRRSPPLQPSSHMKWTFKKVLSNNSLFEKNHSDVLGGSRISWCPNGRFVAFPNAGVDGSKFATCYEVEHDDSIFKSIIESSNYDKYQIQYLYDTSDHPIGEIPLLLKGHTSRIRNVRFSPDVMKPSLRGGNVIYEKFIYFAQCSDDSVLSIWRFKLPPKSNKQYEKVVECICVLQNILDEQSSVEDLSWGNNGKWLAIASSQGGLIIVEFTNDELSSKFYTNWIHGMNISDMSSPSNLIFDYVDKLVNSNEDEINNNKNQKDVRNQQEASDCCIFYYLIMLLTNFIRYISNILIIYSLYNLKVIKDDNFNIINHILYNSYKKYEIWNTILLNDHDVSETTTSENISLKNKRYKRSTSITNSKDINEIWLDMDYSESNTMLNYYWNTIDDDEVDYTINDLSTPKVKCNDNHFEKNTSPLNIITSESKNMISDHIKSQHRNIKWFNLPIIEEYISILNNKVLAINFIDDKINLNSISSTICYVEDDYNNNKCKISWSKCFYNSYTTHLDYYNDILMVITQRKSKLLSNSNTDYNRPRLYNEIKDDVNKRSNVFLTLLNYKTGDVYIDAVSLKMDYISRANLISLNGNMYIILITITGIIITLSIKNNNELSNIMHHDLNLFLSEDELNKIFSIEVVNSCSEGGGKVEDYGNSEESYGNGKSHLPPSGNEFISSKLDNIKTFTLHYSSHLLEIMSPLKSNTSLIYNDSLIPNWKFLCILVHLSDSRIYILTRDYKPLMIYKGDIKFNRGDALSNLYSLDDGICNKMDYSCKGIKNNPIVDEIISNLSGKVGNGFISDSIYKYLNADYTKCNINSLKRKLSACLLLRRTNEYLFNLHQFIFTIFSNLLVDDIEYMTEYLYKSIIKDSITNDEIEMKQVNCFDIKLIDCIGLNCIFILRNVIVLLLHSLIKFIEYECKNRLLTIDFKGLSGVVFNDSSCEYCFTRYCNIYGSRCPLINVKVLLASDLMTNEKLLNILKVLSDLLSKIEVWEGFFC